MQQLVDALPNVLASMQAGLMMVGLIMGRGQFDNVWQVHCIKSSASLTLVLFDHLYQSFDSCCCLTWGELLLILTPTQIGEV